MTTGSCGQEPDECESMPWAKSKGLMSGAKREVAVGEGILLPTITVGRRLRGNWLFITDIMNTIGRFEEL